MRYLDDLADRPIRCSYARLRRLYRFSCDHPLFALATAVPYQIAITLATVIARPERALLMCLSSPGARVTARTIAELERASLVPVLLPRTRRDR